MLLCTYLQQVVQFDRGFDGGQLDKPGLLVHHLRGCYGTKLPPPPITYYTIGYTAVKDNCKVRGV